MYWVGKGRLILGKGSLLGRRRWESGIQRVVVVAVAKAMSMKFHQLCDRFTRMMVTDRHGCADFLLY